MSRLILALTLAVVPTGTVVVIAVQPTPAMACGGNNCP
jgi:hypothetical protein